MSVSGRGGSTGVTLSDDGVVKSGVASFEGTFGSKWYGWAQRGSTYKEGGLRWFKFLARRDADKLAKALR